MATVAAVVVAEATVAAALAAVVMPLEVASPPSASGITGAVAGTVPGVRARAQGKGERAVALAATIIKPRSKRRAPLANPCAKEARLVRSADLGTPHLSSPLTRQRRVLFTYQQQRQRQRWSAVAVAAVVDSAVAVTAEGRARVDGTSWPRPVPLGTATAVGARRLPLPGDAFLSVGLLPIRRRWLRGRGITKGQLGTAKTLGTVATLAAPDMPFGGDVWRPLPDRVERGRDNVRRVFLRSEEGVGGCMRDFLG